GASLRLLPDIASGEERAALLLARAGSFAAMGQFARTHDDLLDCVKLAWQGPAELRVHVTTACAAVEHQLGLLSEAHSHLATALAELEEAESAQAVELMIELTVDGSYAADFEAMRDWAERAVAAATRLDERSLFAAALTCRAWAGAFAGGGERAQQHC